MNHLDHTLEGPQPPNFHTILEQSRMKILALGYHLVLLKSRIKKRVWHLKRMIIVFNT